MRIAVTILLLLALAGAAEATDTIAPGTPVYRVEVILFEHAEGRSDRRFSTEIDTFHTLIDPLRKARDLAARAAWEEHQAELTGQQETDETRLALDLIDALDALDGNLLAEEDAISEMALPEVFLQLDELSPGMQAAWRRLTDSGAYRPLSWRAWHQPLHRQQLAPAVRLHDDQIIRLDWLDVERTLQTLPGQPARRDFELAAFMPEAHYRLDGSMRLRQRQFMHVELDLVWREPVDAASGPLNPIHWRPAGFESHRLSQSRTIRTERLEYFDSAQFGVLVQVVRWRPPAAADIDREP
ncbi:MAG: hypothetical protein JJU31_01610 [Wenzhouxiangella sp.]|nr:hypothetical protein [Wenzhouxiangella sp.]MCH8478665.1 peptidoglycan binding protein CsiV [Wenzhouxiangella sp.]